MTIARRPSKITLPSENKNWNSLYDFLVDQFPLIDASIWKNRLEQGKVHWLSGEIVNAETSFKAGQILCYYREVEQEPIIPFKHEVLFQNDHILIACKPHFLPVTPGGQYVNECLLERIRLENQLPDIVPLHRLDRETAGLVMFSINTETRGLYAQLFAGKKISKSYQAIAKISNEMKAKNLPCHWSISNRLEKSIPKFTMKEGQGQVNAHSEISLTKVAGDVGLFNLNPVTGKTHQLRLHMMKIQMPILNDKFYPVLQAKGPLSFANPLQLLAKKISFVDPITNQFLEFESKRQLETSELFA
jgi:tRNA pseudouridine32 synthase / 23S rRNA pseudouridine746 synthase